MYRNFSFCTFAELFSIYIYIYMYQVVICRKNECLRSSKEGGASSDPSFLGFFFFLSYADFKVLQVLFTSTLVNVNFL